MESDLLFQWDRRIGFKVSGLHVPGFSTWSERSSAAQSMGQSMGVQAREGFGEVDRLCCFGLWFV